MAGTDRGTLNSMELSGFCAQVAMMLSSGMPLYEGMEALAHTYEGSAVHGIYAAVARTVIETGSLHEALKEQSAFPSYLTAMVGIGERAGRAEEVMRALSDYYAREGRIRSAVRSAVTYPLVLAVMMALIVLIMVWKVMPVFRQVLNNMGVTLTESGTRMMDLGAAIAWVVLGLVVLAALIAVICLLMLRTGRREKVMKLIRKVVPPIGRLQLQLSSARVASVLSMMLGGGFPLEEALELVPSVLEDRVAVEEIGKVRERMASGVGFGEALTAGSLFDELYNCMIRTGCEVGCADQAMGRVAKDYEEKVEDGIADMVSIIEPTMVGVLSVVIGAVLLSVMLPMAGVISSIM